eukprot:3301826-Prymnesium_polylepis.1
MRAVIAAHGSIERVPVEKGVDGDALSVTCAQLCRVAVLDAARRGRFVYDEAKRATQLASR